MSFQLSKVQAIKTYRVFRPIDRPRPRGLSLSFRIFVGLSGYRVVRLSGCQVSWLSGFPVARFGFSGAIIGIVLPLCRSLLAAPLCLQLFLACSFLQPTTQAD